MASHSSPHLLTEEKRQLSGLNRAFAEIVSQLEAVRPIATDVAALERDSLQRQIKEIRVDMDDRFHQQQSELNELTAERARLAGQLQENDGMLRLKDMKITSLEGQLRTARQQADDLQLRVNDANVRAEAAEGKSARAHDQMVQLESAITRLEAELGAAYGNVKAEVALRVRAENELVSLKEELDKQSKFYEMKIKSQQADMDHLVQLIDTANRDLHGQTHNQIREALEAAQQGYTAEAEALKLKYIKLYEDFVASEEQRVARHNAALIEELKFVKGQLDAKNRENADLLERERQLSARIEEWRVQVGGPTVAGALTEDINPEIAIYTTWLNQLKTLVAGVGADGFISPARRKRARHSTTTLGEDNTIWETSSTSETALFAGIDIRGSNLEITNRATAAINLHNWSLVVQLPSGDKKTLVFKSLSVPSGSKIRVGAGRNAGDVQFAGLDTFNQAPGTTLLLVDPAGTVAAEAHRTEARANLLSPGHAAAAHLDN